MILVRFWYFTGTNDSVRISKFPEAISSAKLALAVINTDNGDNSGSVEISKGTDPSWEVAFKGQDEGVKVSFIVFNPNLNDRFILQ